MVTLPALHYLSMAIVAAWLLFSLALQPAEAAPATVPAPVPTDKADQTDKKSATREPKFQAFQPTVPIASDPEVDRLHATSQSLLTQVTLLQLRQSCLTAQLNSIGETLQILVAQKK